MKLIWIMIVIVSKLLARTLPLCRVNQRLTHSNTAFFSSGRQGTGIFMGTQNYAQRSEYFAVCLMQLSSFVNLVVRRARY